MLRAPGLAERAALLEKEVRRKQAARAKERHGSVHVRAHCEDGAKIIGATIPPTVYVRTQAAYEGGRAAVAPHTKPRPRQPSCRDSVAWEALASDHILSVSEARATARVKEKQL